MVSATYKTIHKFAIDLLCKRLHIKYAMIELHKLIIAMRALENLAKLANAPQELTSQALALGKYPGLLLTDQKWPAVQLYHATCTLGRRFVRIARVSERRECK